MKVKHRNKNLRKPNFPKKHKYEPTISNYYYQYITKNSKKPTMKKFILTKLSQLWGFITCKLVWVYIALFLMGCVTGYFAVKR